MSFRVLLFGSIVSTCVLPAACGGEDERAAQDGGAGEGGGGRDATAGEGGDRGPSGGMGVTAGSGGVPAAEGGVAGDAQGGAGGSEDDCVPPGGASGSDGAGQSEVLYSNDFESPNQALTVDCGNSLDTRGINFLYGSEAFVFAQTNTVEGVVVNDPGGLYEDPSGIAQNFALGMLSSLQNDLLALTFEVTSHRFLNVGLHLSSIDVQGCGGPFGSGVPVMSVSLYDTPSGIFDISAPGTLLDTGEITGVAAPTPWTFAWQYGVVALDPSAATGTSVTVLFDLLASPYAAFDNLSIVASDTPGVTDRDNNGVADDVCSE